MAIVIIQDGCNSHAFLQCDINTRPLEKWGKGSPCFFNCKGQTVTVGEVIL